MKVGIIRQLKDMWRERHFGRRSVSIFSGILMHDSIRVAGNVFVWIDRYDGRGANTGVYVVRHEAFANT